MLPPLPNLPRCLLPASMLVLFAASACQEDAVDGGEEAEWIVQQGTQLETNKVDVLWVIDNSNSMCQEQAALTANFEAFIDGMTQIDADFRLAVVTTDMLVDNGRFRTGPGISEGCTVEPAPDCPEVTGPVLARSDYLTDPDDPQGDVDMLALQRDFACIATVGTQGSGFEKGLDAAATALSPELLETVNAGFRREDAWLSLVFVADENDCSDGGALDLEESFDCEQLRDSLIPVDLFVDFLESLPGTEEGRRVMAAGILGPDNGVRPSIRDDLRPACTSAERGDAYSGYRYAEFIDAYEDRGVTANICVDSFQVALDEIAGTIRETVGVVCLRTAPATCGSSGDCSPGVECLDPDGEAGGVQVCSDFDVVVETSPGNDQWTELAGPGDAAPAFAIDYDAASCATGVGIAFTAGNLPGTGVAYRIRYPAAASE